MSDNKTYWAADPDSEKVVQKLSEMHGTWSVWRTNPIVQSWIRNICAYYSSILRAGSWDTSLVFGGREGELVEMAVPQAKSIIRQLVTLITKQKLAYQVLARSEKSDVLRDVRFGSSLIDQIIDEEKVDAKAKRVAEGAMVCGQWYMGSLWRQDKGKPHAKNEFGRVMMNGKADIITPSVFDVLYDYTLQDWDDVPWIDLRVTRNRWDLIAENPHLADELMALPSARDNQGPYIWDQGGSLIQEDQVYVYYWIHRPCSALYKGRIIQYVSEKGIISDDKNEYETIPIECMRPEPMMGIGFGYPFFSNLLPAQEMLDHSFSAIATNQSAFAVQNLVAPKGSGVTRQDIGGVNLIHFNPMPNVEGGGRPTALQLTQSSPETFKFLDLLKAHMLDIGNIPGALRGSPPPGVTSGVAIATLTQNALEFINDSGASLHQTLQSVMMHALNAYKKFAKVGHDLTLYGKNNQATTKPFTGKDLENFAAIKITEINPLMQTVTGRVELADKLMEKGMVKSTTEYLQIIEGAPPQKLYRKELSEVDLIDMENEALQDSTPVPVLSTDNHGSHVACHLSLLNDPYVRMNNEAVQTVMDHVLEHQRQSQSVDPYLYAMARTGKEPQGEGEPPPGQGDGGQGAAALPGMPAQEGAQPAEDLLDRQPPPSGLEESL